MTASESEDISTPGDSGETGLGLVSRLSVSRIPPRCNDTGDGSLGVLLSDLTEPVSDMVVLDLNDIPKKKHYTQPRSDKKEFVRLFSASTMLS